MAVAPTTLPARRGLPAAKRPGVRPAISWLAPLVAVATLFYLWPALDALRLSLTDANLLREGYGYTAESYTRVFADPTLLRVLSVTAIFVVCSIVGQLVLGLAIALLVQRAVERKLVGAVLVRTVVLFAWIMPGILVGIVWQVLLNEAEYGLVNAVLGGLGIEPLAFLSDPTLAVVSITVANVWRGTAFSMLLLYAGLQTVDRQLYDAARVDGAGRWAQFWHVTLPQLRPILLVDAILITIATLNTFDMILPLTAGGPAQATEVLALHVYNVVFTNFDVASGSVYAVLLLVCSLLLTFGYRKLLRADAL